ncbi:MAG: LLM class flavin-dependent oxidoreductase [Candidatus Thorarchaeota archaeon]
MRFFIGLYTNWFNEWPVIEEVVLAADQLGFDGVLLPDHYMFSKEVMGARPDRNATLDSWIALTVLASKTEQISLGTLVTPIPLRPPGVLAKIVATLDVLSKGRVVLGVGAGWSDVEFDGYSVWDSAGVRVDRVQEGVELMRRLWTEDQVTFEGRHYHAKKAVLEPKPVQQPYPKLLFGGHKDRMLGLAGRYADIAYIKTAEEDLVTECDYYERAKKKVLRSAKKFNRINEVAFMFGSFHFQLLYNEYNAKEYQSRVEAAKNVGAEYFLTPFPAGRQIEAMKKFANDIIPSFSD